jgi:hypothetical protein
MNELQQKIHALMADLPDENDEWPGGLDPALARLRELETPAADAPVRSQALAAAGQRELQEHLDAYGTLVANLRSLSKHLGDEPDTLVTEELFQHASAIHAVACGYVAVKRALTVPKCVNCGKPAVETKGSSGVTVSFCPECAKMWQRFCGTHCSKCEAESTELDKQGRCPRCAKGKTGI